MISLLKCLPAMPADVDRRAAVSVPALRPGGRGGGRGRGSAAGSLRVEPALAARHSRRCRSQTLCISSASLCISLMHPSCASQSPVPLPNLMHLFCILMHISYASFLCITVAGVAPKPYASLLHPSSASLCISLMHPSCASQSPVPLPNLPWCNTHCPAACTPNHAALSNRRGCDRLLRRDLLLRWACDRG